MKHVFYLIGIFLLFVSCKDEKQMHTNYQTLKTYFEGEWVKSGYLADVTKTKSPYVSRNQLKGIVTLLIDTGKLHGDSLVVGASWNNHEGYRFAVYFKKSHNESSFSTNIVDYEDSTNYYELGFSNHSKDTFVILFHFNGTHVLTDSTKYVKVKQRISDDAGDPIQYIVNKLLFSAEYRLYDSAGNQIPVEFTKEGNVKGFKDYYSYFVGTDFIGDPGAVDYVTFNNGSKNHDCYAYKIIQDTIKLYEISERGAGDTITERLKYILKKI
jgi:hypothetical protein